MICPVPTVKVMGRRPEEESNTSPLSSFPV